MVVWGYPSLVSSPDPPRHAQSDNQLSDGAWRGGSGDYGGPGVNSDVASAAGPPMFRIGSAMFPQSFRTISATSPQCYRLEA